MQERASTYLILNADCQTCCLKKIFKAQQFNANSMVHVSFFIKLIHGTLSQHFKTSHLRNPFICPFINFRIRHYNDASCRVSKPPTGRQVGVSSNHRPLFSFHRSIIKSVVKPMTSSQRNLMLEVPS